MNELNPYYLYLQANLPLLKSYFQGLEPHEESNDTIKTCILFMTIDRLASTIAKEDGYKDEVVHACVALSYTDVYLVSGWILEDLKRAES